MRNNLHYEHICDTCGEIFTLDHREFECPICGSDNVRSFRVIHCDCGEEFDARGFTIECPECGALYNGFGQRLADPREWDPDDRYDSFGPQECEYGY